MSSEHIFDVIRRKYPAMGRRMDYENSRAAAIRSFCIQCVGECLADIATCANQRCSLWPFRGSGNTVRDPGVVPTLEEYRALAPEPNEAALEGLRRAREARAEVEA